MRRNLIRLGGAAAQDAMAPGLRYSPKGGVDIVAIQDRGRTGLGARNLAPMERLDDLKAEWAERRRELNAIRSNHVEPINNWAREQGVPHVAVPGA